MFEDNEKKCYLKELDARDEIYEERITKMEEAYKKQLYNLQLKVEEFKRQSEDNEELHSRESFNLKLKVEELEREIGNSKQSISNLQVKVEELNRQQVQTLEDSKELHRKEICSLQLKIDELKKQETKKIQDIEETHKNEIYNLTLMIEKFKREEIKKLEDQVKDQKLLIEALKEGNKELAKQLTMVNKTLVRNREFNTKFEVFERNTEKENETLYKRLHDLQLEVDRQAYCLKQQLQLKVVESDNVKFESELKTESEECIKEKHQQGQIADSSSVYSTCGTAEGSSLNPDVLALMHTTGVYKHPALSYDLQTATISINCDDPAEKEKVKADFFTAYRYVRIKEYVCPVEDIQQAKIMVDECTKIFNYTYFKYDPEKKQIKCLSTDPQQIQNVQRRLNSMIKDPKVKSVFIDLPKKSRKVTIKLSNIIEEEVDIIVNAANNRLMHAGGVAAATDRASYGAVQKESSKLIEVSRTLPTGEVVVTNAGGKLKCKQVVHAVGPIAQHKDQCGPLLHKACVNSMIMAQRSKAKSISFPPISSGIFGVSKELVANVMLSSLCSYTCNDPELLNDVRIVIIDEPTFDVFLKYFHKERGNLEALQHIDPTAISTYQQVGNSPWLGTHQLGTHKSLTNSVSIDLPQLFRKVTIKLGDVVQEEVDAIVNAANDSLSHLGGVAAAINKASGGVVQRECTKVIRSKILIPTGDAVATTAGGALKCKYVIQAVGPTAIAHKNRCAALLKKACTSAMDVARYFEAISIVFPPISSGHCGVSTELVANVMLSTLCAYKCNNPALLNDVRIVIIDRPTYEVFLSVFYKEQQSINKIYNNTAAHVATTTTTPPGVLKPSTFHYSQPGGNIFSPDSATKLPGHGQPISYSQAVTNQPLEVKNLTSGNFNPPPVNPPQPSSLQDYSQTTSRNASFMNEKHTKSLPVTSEPNHDPNDLDNVQGGTSHLTWAQSNDSNNDYSSGINGDKESIRNLTSIKSVNVKVNKHGEDDPTDRYKEPNNDENKDNTHL